MKKQTKKQTAAKRQVTKPRQAKAKSQAKATVKPKATPKKLKKSAALPPKTKPKKAKPVVIAPPSAGDPVVQSKPVVAVLPPPVAKPNHSEMEELRRIEMALAEVENAMTGTTGQPVTINTVPAILIADITELLEELIDTASPKLASTISRLAYVLCEVLPGLQAVSKRADIALCRKCGVTFGWDRQAEAERAVRSGKYQKSIAVS